MKSPTISLDLRRRVVAAYRSKKTPTYKATAEMFGIGEATVIRLLRRYRETGDVLAKPRGGNNPKRVDDAWLLAHAEQFPDATLAERIVAWEAVSGRRVASGTMSDAPGKGVHGSWRMVTMLGALALDGIRTMVAIEAATCLFARVQPD